MAFQVIPLKKIIPLQFAKLFWNGCFKPEELKFSEIKYDIERKWETQLTNFRDESIRNLNMFIEMNKLPFFFKTTFTKSIFILHRAYHQLLLWKITYDPDNKINLLEDGELYAPNYFTVEGEFRDLIWTKRFLHNSNYSVLIRFNLACCFWFEHECEYLWTEVSNLYGTGLGIFDHLKNNYGLISLTILKIEHADTLHGDFQGFDVSFWQLAFSLAAKSGYEHAVYFLWQKMKESEKANIIEKVYDDFMSRSIDYPRDKISHFIFSKLSKERKSTFLDWTIRNNRSQVWLSLLITIYEKSGFSEILLLIHKLPIVMFAEVLQALSNRIEQFKFPLDIELFQLLWKNLTPKDKHYIQIRMQFLIETLVEANLVHDVGTVIKCFMLEQKRKGLFNGWYKVGITILDILSRKGEFDLVSEYLSFFLFDTDLETKNQMLRINADLFLERFVESSEFITWSKSKISEDEETKVKNQIEVLKISSTLLYELCDKVSEGVNISQSARNNFV